ncbi:MAG: GNAT family protein [Prolixibacteraceae bacterium]|jgi:RimJ/RimL family protein N-acetyltransferase
MLDKKLILQTEQVLLRPMRKNDLTEFLLLTQNKKMWIYFTSDLSEANELEKWVDDAISQTENGSRLAFTIVDKTSGKIAGSTSLGNISLRDRRAEIGWTWLGTEFQGKGANSQTKYLLLNYCFEFLKFERVEIKTDILNIPARKTLQRIGFTEEGILRSHTLMTHNRRRDTIYYSVLKGEWPDLKIRNGWF